LLVITAMDHGWSWKEFAVTVKNVPVLCFDFQKLIFL